MKKIGLTCLAIALAVYSFAQNEVDALRYSQLEFSGTARYNSMGGAFGALGGDFTTLSTNPAGIGVYRRSELSLTTGFNSNAYSSTYLGTQSDASRGNVNIGNIGWISNYNSEKTTGWVSGSFGIGYNRLADFNSNVRIVGTNEESSLLDVYRNRVQGVNWGDVDTGGFYDFGASLAWQTVLIDTFLGETNYITQIPFYGQQQIIDQETSGRVGETVIAFGGNYENRLYLGGTFGISSVRYNRESTFEEVLPAGDTSTFLNDFTFRENLNTRGNGYTLKIGAIYRLTDYLRLGAAVHSPTWMVLEDRYSTSFEANYPGFGREVADSPDGLFEYRLRTPYRLSASAAGLFKKHGLISADIEYVDYASARLSERFAGDYDFNAENEVIRNSYQGAMNVRVGGELRLMPIAIRAGYAYQGSPYNSDVIDNDGSVQNYSFGVGYRNANLFLDFGYVLRVQKEDYYPYDPSIAAPAQQDRTLQRYQITVGLKY